MERQNADKYSMLQVLSNDDLDFEEQKELENLQNTQPIIELASHINNAWEAAKTAKIDIERKLLQNQRRRKGEYDPEDLSAIRKFGGSEVYMMLTSMKCRAAESWITDVMIPAGEKPWSIEPTPMPDIPGDKEAIINEQVQAEVMQIMQSQGPESVTPEMVKERIDIYRDLVNDAEKQKAKKVAIQQEVMIEDDLVQGNFYRELRKVISDFVTYQACFIKGPVYRNKKKRVWKDGEVVVERYVCREFERVSPLNMYPAPSSRHINDGDLIEHMRLRRKTLNDCIGVDGFNEDAIRGALKEYGDGGLRHWLWTDTERESIENREWDEYDPEKTIDVLEYWGSVQGSKLLEWGMDPMEIDDLDMDYQVSAWLIGTWVVMARINPHKLGHVPYYSSCYENIPDSIWGVALPETMSDCQKICNAAARAIVNNMSIASGPQVEINTDRLDPSEDAEDIYPWKIWRTVGDATSGGKPAVQFFQPTIIAGELQAIYDYYFKQASEQSGIPAYVYGDSSVGGAGKTASGLSMLMNAAGKILKGVISHLDSDLIKPLIEDLWFDKMINDEDFPKHGDIDIRTRASDTLLIAEQLNMLRQNFLAQTANPIDMQIIGIDGRAKVLKEQVKSLRMEEDIVPDPEEMMIQQQDMEMQQENANQQQQVREEE